MHRLSRRCFIGLAAAAPFARSQSRTAVVDAHMHVWSNDTARFPFAHPYDPKFKPPPLAGTAEMLLEEMDRKGIDFAILIQVIYYGWDNRYVAECARKEPRRFRAHGLIDPTDPEVARKLEYWTREHRLAGMRFSPIYYRGREEWMTSEPHHALWKKAEELGSVFNFFIAAPQLGRLETMVASFPGVRVVIDHLARVDLTVPDPSTEIVPLARLARYPNVWVKVTELNIISPSKQHPYADTFPWVRRVYDAFGPDRLLWGTGYPGATRAQAGRPSLDEELSLVRSEIPFLTAEDREKILGRNAVMLWKLA